MSRKISHLFVDFDETLTVADTINTLSSLAYVNPRTPPPPPWSFFAESYLADLSKCSASLVPACKRKTIQQEIDCYSSLRKVEEASIKRIEEHGMFSGLKISTIAKASAGVKTRDGWWRVVKSVIEAGGRVDVLSVNWSSEWIRKVLSSAVGEDIIASGVRIYSNNLITEEVNGEIVCTGKFDRYFGKKGGLWAVRDKLKIMQKLVEADEQDGGDGLTVYIGDSATDLLCLLEADLGIVVGEKLDGVCSRLDIEVRKGLESCEGTQSQNGNVLWSISQWDEIMEWLGSGDT